MELSPMRPLHRGAATAAALLLSAYPPHRLTAQRPLQATDYYKLVVVANPALSPDGRRVAFAVTTVVEDKDKRHSEIWMASADGSGKPYRYTSPATEASSPRWSPDGSLLAFTSKREGADDDAWFLRSGAPGGEAFQIAGVHALPVFSPDGRQLLYEWRGPEPDSLKQQPWRERVSPAAITRGPDPKRFDGRLYTSLPVVADERGLVPPRETRRPRHLYVAPLDGGDPAQLTSGEVAQTDPAWSPDGRAVVFVQDSTETVELDVQPRPQPHGVGRGAGGRGTGAARHLVQRRLSRPARHHPGRYVLVCGHGRLADRGVADETLRLPGGQEVPPRAVHPRGAALELRERVLPRVPNARRAGVLDAVHEPARLERLRPCLHVRDTRPLGDGGLQGSHAGGGRRDRAGGGGYDEARGTGRLVWRFHDELDRGAHHQRRGGGDRSLDLQLVLLVRLFRRAGPHGLRVLRRAVAQRLAVSGAVAHDLRESHAHSDAHRAQRGRPAHAHHRRRAVVPAAAPARRAGGVRAVSALVPRAVPHRAALAPGGPVGADPDLVRALAGHGRDALRGRRAALAS